MKGITYPLYTQRKALRDLSDSNSLWVTAMYVGILVAVISSVVTVSWGAGAVVFGASWAVTKFLFDKHPSDITREQFERTSEALKVVSLELYSRVEDGTDTDGTPESERFYTAYTTALALEKGADLGDFWEAVRQAEHAMREWNSVRA